MSETGGGSGLCVLLATRNAGKLREIREKSAGAPWRWVGLEDFPNVPEAPEEAPTLEENARAKAVFYARATGLTALADDSGLVVDSLGGEPGVHSAYYAGLPRDDAANNRKLIAELRRRELNDDRARAARFRCELVLAGPDGRILLTAGGALEGRIVDQPRGAGGFGYDPHFFVPSMGRCLAELTSAEKNAISHRGQAMEQMLKQMRALFAAD